MGFTPTKEREGSHYPVQRRLTSGFNRQKAMQLCGGWADKPCTGTPKTDVLRGEPYFCGRAMRYPACLKPDLLPSLFTIVNSFQVIACCVKSSTKP